MKIGFITDTNFLKKSEERLRSCQEVLDTTDIFVEYIEELSSTDSNNELVYFMPNIVIEELFSQKKKLFEEQYKNLNQKFNNISYALIGEFPKNNIESIIIKEKENYLPKYENINLSYSSELFEDLVKEAIDKKPPFDKSKQGKKTDSGFKDALIWKTVLNSKKIDECEIIYFFSSDKIFSDNQDELIEEFKKYHKNTNLKIIFFESDGNQKQNALQLLISENNLIETDVIKLYNKDRILSIIRNLKYNYSKDIIYSEEDKIKIINILFKNFVNDDFVILDVNRVDDKQYEVILSFKTKEYQLNNPQVEIEKLLFGNISLYISIKNEEFHLESSKINEVSFYKNDFDKLISIIRESFSNIYSKELDTIIKSLNESIVKTFEPLQNINYPSQFQELKESISATSGLQELKNNINILNTNVKKKKLISAINESTYVNTASDDFANNHKISNQQNINL